MPRQYARGNQAEIEEQDQDDSSVDSNNETILRAFLESCEDIDEREVGQAITTRTSYCNTAFRTVEVSIPGEQRRACLNSLTLPVNFKTSIMDSGADTCIIGQGWRVVEMHPTRRVRVVGFDKEITTKNNLPIVTAMTIVDVPKHGPVLLQVNEAVLNESADHSLMSAYQMSEYGIPLDARPSKHDVG